MNLSIPVVGIDPGPDYATNVNNSLTIIDGHNHSPGYGVQITPSGLNINTDLPFNSNNATQLRSVRFTPNASVLSLGTDLGCLYETGVDLYYNDGNGNQIQITKNGSIAGTSGSISGLVSPASASYVSSSQVFVWQSAANTPANMDFASATLRNLVANSHGYTINPPNSMAADYSIVLPLPPGQTSVLSIDSSGNITPSFAVAGGITSSNIASGTITGTNIAANTITQDLLAIKTPSSPSASLGGVAYSASSGNATFQSLTYQTALTCQLTCSGSPVMLLLQGDGNGSSTSDISNSGSGVAVFGLFRNGTVVSEVDLDTTSSTGFPPGMISCVDLAPGTGTNTYTLQIRQSSNSPVGLHYCVLVAYEL